MDGRKFVKLISSGIDSSEPASALGCGERSESTTDNFAEAIFIICGDLMFRMMSWIFVVRIGRRTMTSGLVVFRAQAEIGDVLTWGQTLVNAGYDTCIWVSGISMLRNFGAI